MQWHYSHYSQSRYLENNIRFNGDTHYARTMLTVAWPHAMITHNIDIAVYKPADGALRVGQTIIALINSAKSQATIII